jgi:hypothetical protein
LQDLPEISFIPVAVLPLTGVAGSLYKLPAGTFHYYEGGVWVQVPTGGGTADQFQVINWNGYLQFTQAPTTWYHKQYNPQGGSWLTAPWNANIGSTPTGFLSSPNSERLLQNCYLDKAFIYLHNTNGARTLNIKWYKFNRTQANDTPTNVVEICNISKAVVNQPNQAFVLNTDFTINNANLSEGDFITFVINQTDNAQAAATNWSMYLIFKKR